MHGGDLWCRSIQRARVKLLPLSRERGGNRIDPRVRGWNGFSTLTMASPGDQSPRARVEFSLGVGARLVFRSIPAGAGETWSTRQLLRPRPIDPACAGGTGADSSRGLGHVDRSPRARVEPKQRGQQADTSPIDPTCAGGTAGCCGALCLRPIDPPYGRVKLLLT